jgi:hypothetical protein
MMTVYENFYRIQTAIPFLALYAYLPNANLILTLSGFLLFAI